MRVFNITIFFCALVIIQACTPSPKNVRLTNDLLVIYPEYKDVTIPFNVAPLNFLIRNEGVDAVSVEVKGISTCLQINAKGNKAVFSQKDWTPFMAKERGHKLVIKVIARINGEWLQYRSFTWQVVADPLDAYVSYRLIEPGYEVWNKLQLRERCIENFDERVLADNSQTNGQCMNCHIHGKGNSSMFHIRGSKGGTLLNRHGKLRKLMLKTPQMNSAAVYGDFHPDGRYAVFSTNTIIPALHAQGNHRLEVYDTVSDLVIADFDRNKMIASPLLADSLTLETFPTFSADGKWVFYCSAPLVDLPSNINELRYSLCRVAFEAEQQKWGSRVDTLWNARLMQGSVCHPKASPDGRYLLFTVSRYGTFPIWHRETDLQLLDLLTGKIDKLERVNSNRSETYHSWSSNSRWFAFASKRGDGQYGRVYFAYVDEMGQVHKPFVLPQKDPEMDDLNLKSYNIPDLSAMPMPFDSHDVKRVYDEVVAEKFK